MSKEKPPALAFEERDALRRAFDRHLRRLVDSEAHLLSPNNITGEIKMEYRAAGTEGRWSTRHEEVLLERWWQFCRTGFIAVSGGAQVFGQPQHVTEEGRRWLAEDTSPHDRVAFLDSLSSDLPTELAPVIDYVDEAIASWQAGCYRASLVMIGCASELMVRHLAQALIDSGKVRNDKKLRDGLALIPSSIANLFDEVRVALSFVLTKNELTELVDRQLQPVFHQVRVLRNEAGHPSGARVDADEAYSAIRLTRTYLKLVKTLLEQVARPMTPSTNTV